MPYISNFRGLLFYDHPSKAGALFVWLVGRMRAERGTCCVWRGASGRGLPVWAAFWVAFREAVFGEKGRAAVRAA